MPALQRNNTQSKKTYERAEPGKNYEEAGLPVSKWLPLPRKQNIDKGTLESLRIIQHNMSAKSFKKELVAVEKEFYIKPGHLIRMAARVGRHLHGIPIPVFRGFGRVGA